MTVETRKDLEGNVLVRGKCSVCSKCWIYLANGNCIYGGPFKGYVKENNNHDTTRDRQETPTKS